jgi:hypothetical protein
VDRAIPFFAGLNAESKLQFIVNTQGQRSTSSERALAAFFQSLGLGRNVFSGGKPPLSAYDSDPALRIHRQFDQMVAFTQALIRTALDRRKEFWAKADASTPQRWKGTTQFYRDYIWGEVIGRLPPPSLPFNARTRLTLDAASVRRI